MPRLIIDYPDEINTLDAIHFALEVIRGGRISKHKNGNHFCWATTFNDGKYTVLTRMKRKNQTSDSLVILKESKPNA